MRIILNNGKYVNKVASTALSLLLLDSLSNSAGAFSLRKLNSSYSGNAIQVRRSSDNTTQDIGFVNNQLDTASLNTFCSGTNGFISIWYNQSDASNNAIQTTAANQPKIYDSSTGVELENGKPTIKFIKTNSNWLEVTDTSFGHIQDAISNFSVVKLDSASTFFPTVFSKSYLENGAVVVNTDNPTRNLKLFFDTESLLSSHDISNTHTLISNFVNSGTNGVQIYANSILKAQKTTSPNLTGTNSYKFSIGRNNKDNSYYWNGAIQEIILFSSNQTSNKTTIEDNINTYYSIYGLLLDDLSDSTGGFSLRKLKSSYSGKAIQVRRASDNTTQDIGFVNNQLDTATLNSFCSGTDGFVTIWYNQSDTSNNAIQTTAANQPKIYDSSTGVELENGKPAINFILANDNWLEVTDTSFGNVGDVISNFTVTKLTSGTYPTIMGKGIFGDGNHQFFRYPNSYYYSTRIDSYLYYTGYDNLGSQLVLSNINLVGTDGVKVYANSNIIATRTTTSNLSGTNTDKFYIGKNSAGSSNNWNGTIQEIILFSNDQTSNRTTIETDINTNYSIY